MCYVCCREFKRWWKSFTGIEIILTILQLVLLIIFIGFLLFLILHLLVCDNKIISYGTSTEKVQQSIPSIVNFSTATTKPYRTTSERFSKVPKMATYKRTTFNKTLNCTWSPSHTTKAQTRFFEIISLSYKMDTNTSTDENFQSTAPYFEYVDDNGAEIGGKTSFTQNTSIFNDKVGITSDLGDATKSEFINNDEAVDDVSSESDGEEVGDKQPTVVLALVKVKPPTDVTFGCILTVLTKHWTITAATCIESIEEMDSLDSFVIMEDYGYVKKGRTHVVSDVQIHPLYEGTNRSYDLAALKSEGNLLRRSGRVELATLFDYFMMTIGERFNIFGYGPFRSIDKGPNGRRLRRVNVYTLPSRQCPEESESWALRHLWPVEAVEHAPCASAPTPICAGVLYARGVSCNYCAGTPLLAGSKLYGVMSDARQCGVACDPQPYVNIAVLRDWLDSVIGNI